MITAFKKKFIGNRAFYAMVLAVAVPIMVQNGITNFVSLLDNIMVGRLGTEQMSGVSIVNQLIFVYNLFMFGGLSGAGIFTAQYFGQKNEEGIRQTIRYKIWIALTLTVIAILLAWTQGRALINLYLTESVEGGDLQAAFVSGNTYLRLMLLGLPAFMAQQVYASTLRECGETVVPMKAGLTAVFVNLVFNYFLIYGKFGFPEMGVAGAALATVISRYVEAAIVILWTYRHTKEAPYFVGLYQTLKIPAEQVKRYFIKGLPLLVNEGLWSIGMAVLNQCYSVRGLSVVAGLNIANTINNVFTIGYIALGDSVAIIVGQLLGAGKMKEARDTDNKMIAFAVFSCIGVALLLAVLAPVFPNLYNTTEHTRKIATDFIVMQALFMPQNAFLHCAYFTLHAGGRTGMTFLYDCLFMWCLSIPLVFFLSHQTALYAPYVYVMMQISEWGKSIFGFILVKKGVWIRNIVGDSNAVS